MQDADLDILDSDEDEIDEDSAVYLESLQDKISKHVNGNMQVGQKSPCHCGQLSMTASVSQFRRNAYSPNEEISNEESPLNLRPNLTRLSRAMFSMP